MFIEKISGDVSRTYNLEHFNSIKVGFGFVVHLEKGEDPEEAYQLGMRFIKKKIDNATKSITGDLDKITP